MSTIREKEKQYLDIEAKLDQIRDEIMTPGLQVQSYEAADLGRGDLGLRLFGKTFRIDFDNSLNNGMLTYCCLDRNGEVLGEKNVEMDDMGNIRTEDFKPSSAGHYTLLHFDILNELIDSISTEKIT
jgi:hypothetical protein